MLDWFFNLDGPAQVALIVGLFGGGGAAAIITALRGRSQVPQTRPAEIAALTLDSSAVRAVAGAIEALNLSEVEANKIARENVAALRRLAEELKELRGEIRTQGDRR